MSEPIDNPYRAPDAVVAEVGGDATATAHFYVVAPFKAALLLAGTAGLYSIYWFYRNWRQLDRVHDRYWPAMRAIFPYFFTHSLFAEVDHRLRRDGKAYRWAPTWLASVCVACMLGSTAIGAVGDLAGTQIRSLFVTSVIATGMQVITWWTLYRAQRAINVACDDPEGLGNRRITVFNGLWITLGAALWAMNIWAWWILLQAALG